MSLEVQTCRWLCTTRTCSRVAFCFSWVLKNTKFPALTGPVQRLIWNTDEAHPAFQYILCIIEVKVSITRNFNMYTRR